MLTIKNHRMYRRVRDGGPQTVFVYTVHGTPKKLTKFKDCLGEYYRENDLGTPLYFSTRCYGDDTPLIITDNGRLVPDVYYLDTENKVSLTEQFEDAKTNNDVLLLL